MITEQAATRHLMNLSRHSFSAESDLVKDWVDKCSAISLPCSPLLRTSREVATSLWQKAIRRGQQSVALRAVETLLELDADYVWRRVRVIALEDVSIGSLPVVAGVLAIAGKKTIRRIIGEKQLARLITCELAKATKSRTACDLLSWLAVVPAAGNYKNAVRSSIASQIAHLESSDEAWKIAAVAQLISGHTERREGRYVVVSRPSAALRGQLLDSFGATGLVRYVAEKGGGTYGLNLLLPYVLKNVLPCDSPKPSTTVHTMDAHEYVGHVEAYAYCMYTPEGRAAFKHFLRRESDLRRALTASGCSSGTLCKALGTLVYQVEGALLDRDVESAWTRSVRAAANDAELFILGLEPSTHERLRELTRAHIPAFNDSRRAVLVGLRPMQSIA